MTEEMDRSGVLVHRVEIGSPTAQALIGAVNAELTNRYPEEGARHFRVDPDEVAAGGGAFLIAC